MVMLLDECFTYDISHSSVPSVRTLHLSAEPSTSYRRQMKTMIRLVSAAYVNCAFTGVEIRIDNCSDNFWSMPKFGQPQPWVGQPFLYMYMMMKSMNMCHNTAAFLFDTPYHIAQPLTMSHTLFSMT